MTRINVISVMLLTDQHLLAEYREITRVSSLSKPLPEYGNYKLGTGHVKFFYDKGSYLAKRTHELYRECIARGFKVTKKEYMKHDSGLNNTFTPTKEDIQVNLERIFDKLKEGENKYRYFGKKITFNKYKRMVEDAQ